MGLDVYLYRYDVEKAVMDKLEKQYETASNKAWHFGGKTYEQLTAAEKSQARATNKATALKLGLDKDGEHPGKVKIEIDSALYPDHMFKIGYLRSSYNDEGINRVLRNAGLHDLSEIFQPGERYAFRPDWDEALARAKYVLDRWQLRQESEESKFFVFEIAPNPFGGAAKPPSDEREALL